MPYAHKTVKELEHSTLTNVEHSETNECEAGLDLTDFGSKQNFQNFVDDHNLEYRRVEKEDGGYYYTYSNEDVLIILGNNPVSGVYTQPEMRDKETGYASYIGITGKCGVVKEVYEDIKERANYVKGGNPNEREFI